MAGEPYNEILYKAAEKTIANSGGTVASPAVVVGNVAHDAVNSGAPVLIGGAADNGVPAAVAVGDRAQIRTNLTGDIGVGAMSGASGAGADNRLVLFSFAGRTGAEVTNTPVWTAGAVLNGTGWDRLRKPNITKRIASSAAAGNPDFLKASAGDLVQFWGQNGAAITYLQFYNKATAPTIGTDTPILTFPVAANERFNVQIPGGGYYFATGIAYAFTTDAAGATGATAAAVTSCNIIGA